MLIKPGPAKVGLPSMAGMSGNAFRIAVATSRGFLGAPSCQTFTIKDHFFATKHIMAKNRPGNQLLNSMRMPSS